MNLARVLLLVMATGRELYREAVLGNSDYLTCLCYSSQYFTVAAQILREDISRDPEVAG